MLPIAYNLQLRAPREDSPEWYRKFHNRYYLFTLSNLLLLSYIKTYVFYTQNTESEEVISKDIENFLEELISKVKKQDLEIENLLVGMGIIVEDRENKEINIDLKELLRLTSGKNWHEVIKGLLNSWEFLCLYANTETALKEILGLTGKGKIDEELLLPELFNRYVDLEQKLQEKADLYSKSLCEDIWKFYTRLRNIYAHSFGFIPPNIRNAILGGLRNDFIKSWEEINDKNSVVYFIIKEQIDDSFSKKLLHADKIYLLSDVELNVFRNFTIHLAESLEEIAKN